MVNGNFVLKILNQEISVLEHSLTAEKVSKTNKESSYKVELKVKLFLSKENFDFFCKLNNEYLYTTKYIDKRVELINNISNSKIEFKEKTCYLAGSKICTKKENAILLYFNAYISEINSIMAYKLIK